MLTQLASVAYENGHAGRSSAALRELLSKDDSFTLLDLISDSHQCSTYNEYSGLLRRLAALIEADHCMCAHARTNGRKRILSFDVLNVDFPAEWLETYLSKKYYRIDPVVKENYKHFRVQSWEETYPKYKDGDTTVNHASAFSIKRGCSYGIKSDNGRGGSLFSFSGPSVKKSDRSSLILKIVVPELHLRLISVLTAVQETHKKKLTETERKIVGCMAEGLNNPQIAQTCNISRNTVKFHVKNVLQKMNVQNRLQVVAKVHKKGI